MTLLQDFDLDDTIRWELSEYDYVKSLINETCESDVHHTYLCEELLDCMNNLIGHGFYLIEWNKSGPLM